ncbi:MAG: hypothetical protein GY759_14505 [Chloroflexi bacterium]|nr:hypothetical protein [Chloroflexota bacterium]
MTTLFPSLDGFEPTRQTLQTYGRAVAAIPRAYAEPHPKWWHVSLKVQPDGLLTDKISLPDGGAIRLKIDLVQHAIVLFKNRQPAQTWDMTEGLTATVLGNEIIAAVEDLGLKESDYGREKFENDDPRLYDRDTIPPFLTALTNADHIFKAHRETLDGEVSPVQLWSHGFDLAFEWFGSRIERYEEEGEITAYPSQLNLGFFPAEPAYFYSNPWPFEADALLGKPLPNGARWHTEGWNGSELLYSELQGVSDAEARLEEFARAVYEAVAPTLLAGWKA